MLGPDLCAQIVSLRPDIAGFIRARGRKTRARPADLDDEVQEALTEILRNAPRYRAELGEFRPWAFGIALKVHLRCCRTRIRYDDSISQEIFDPGDYAANGPSPERWAQIRQARDCIENAIDGMPSDQYAALRLHVFERFKHEEIAVEMGISVALSKKLVQRAREYLAKQGVDEATFFSTHPPFVETSAIPDDASPLWRVGYDYVFRAGHVASLLSVLTLAGFVRPNAAPVVWFTVEREEIAALSNVPPDETIPISPTPENIATSAPVFVPPNRAFTQSPNAAPRPIRIDVKPPGKTLYLRKTR